MADLFRTKRHSDGFAETLRRVSAKGSVPSRAVTTRRTVPARDVARLVREKAKVVATLAATKQSERNAELHRLIAEQRADMADPTAARPAGPGSRTTVRGSLSLDQPISRHERAGAVLGDFAGMISVFVVERNPITGEVFSPAPDAEAISYFMALTDRCVC